MKNVRDWFGFYEPQETRFTKYVKVGSDGSSWIYDLPGYFREDPATLEPTLDFVSDLAAGLKGGGFDPR